MKFECEKCHKEFNTKHGHKAHMNKKFPCTPVIILDPNTCEICLKTFVSQHNLEKHKKGTCKKPKEKVMPNNPPQNNQKQPNPKPNNPPQPQNDNNAFELDNFTSKNGNMKYNIGNIIKTYADDNFINAAVFEYINQIHFAIITIYVYTEQYGESNKSKSSDPKLQLSNVMSNTLIGFGGERLNELFDLCRYADTRDFAELSKKMYDTDKKIQCIQCGGFFHTENECIKHQSINCPNNYTNDEKKLCLFKNKHQDFDFIGLKQKIIQKRTQMLENAKN